MQYDNNPKNKNTQKNKLLVVWGTVLAGAWEKNYSTQLTKSTVQKKVPYNPGHKNHRGIRTTH